MGLSDAQLDALADLSPDDIRRLKRASTPSARRRTVLKAGGLVGAAALLGGGATGAASAETAADTVVIEPGDDARSTIESCSGNTRYEFSTGVHEVHLVDGDGIRVTASNTTIYLREGAVVKLADGEVGDGGTGSVFTIRECENVAVDGPGVIDGNISANSVASVSDFAGLNIAEGVSRVSVEAVTVRNCPGRAIFSGGAGADDRNRGIGIEDVTIHDCEEGILWLATDAVSIHDCDISHIIQQDGIEPARYAAGFAVTNNDIYDFVPGNTGSAIDCYDGAAHGYIAGNTIRGTATDLPNGAISIGGGERAVHDITVVGGSIIAPEHHGVLVRGEAPYVHDITIDGVTILDAGETGVVVGGQPEAVSVTDCSIRRPGGDGVNTHATDGKVRGNTIRGGRYGVLVTGDCDGVTVLDNDIGDSSQYDIWIDAGATRVGAGWNVLRGPGLHDASGDATVKQIL